MELLTIQLPVYEKDVYFWLLSRYYFKTVKINKLNGH